ncbi:MAG: cysteine hydrolase family protein [Ferrimicrobium sp.]
MTQQRVVSNWTDGLDHYVAPDLTRSALLVIDTQVDFCDSGASPIPGTTAVLPAIASLLAAYRSIGLPIVHVVRLYEGGDVDLVRRSALLDGTSIVRPGSAGSQIAPELWPQDAGELDATSLLAGCFQKVGVSEVVIRKPRWSAFYRTPLKGHLTNAGVTTIVVAGCNYPNCPRATIYDASERDYRVLIASDAISGLDDRHLVEAERIGVVHAPSTVLVEWFETSLGDHR